MKTKCTSIQQADATNAETVATMPEIVERKGEAVVGEYTLWQSFPLLLFAIVLLIDKKRKSNGIVHGDC